MRLAPIAATVSALALAAGALLAQVPDGVYSGKTTQNRTLSVTVSGGAVTSFTVGWTGLCSSSGNTTINTSCPLSGNSFSCGSAFCGAPGQANIAISGTFEGPHVRGATTVSFMSPSFCCATLSNMQWIASATALLLQDGFETGSIGGWTAATGGPFLEFWVRNRFWNNSGTDTFTAQIDGTPVFTLAEAVPGWQNDYRKAIVNLSAYAGGNHDLILAATSFADSTRADFYLDDVAITCPSPVANPVTDPGFEAGSPSVAWAEVSTNFGTPLCTSPSACSSSNNAHGGSWWAHFGRDNDSLENGSLTQTAVAVPVCP